MSYNFLFLDTETTGNQPEDRLCQVAYKRSDTNEIFESLFKPPLPISVESSAVCHITNRMVEDKPPFVDSAVYARLGHYFQEDDLVFVAHNAQFDLGMLEKEGLAPKQFICTFKVARELDDECIIPRYNLQFLRYYYDFEIEAVAHDAFGDVLVLETLFYYLIGAVMEKKGFTHEEAVKWMIEISSQPSLIRTFTFGKHNGKKIVEVAVEDKPYLAWLYNQKMQNPDGEDDWLYTLKQYI